MLRRVVLLALCALLAASAVAPNVSADHANNPPANHEWQEITPKFNDITHTNRWRCERSTNCKVFAGMWRHMSIAVKSCVYRPDTSGNYTAQAGFDCGHSAPAGGGWLFLSDASNHTSTGLAPTCSNGTWHGPAPVLPAAAVQWTTAGHCGTWTPTPTPTVSIRGATVTEGERAVLTITSSGGRAGSVEYRVVNGSAVAGSDFRDPGAASIPIPASGTATASVSTIDDSDVESSESFIVVLSNPSGCGHWASGTATVTILDNDNAPPPCPAGQTGIPPNCVPIPLPCPAGQTGTPPNCVPIGTPPCPAGQTGTPPNCVPVVVSTGCDAPGTRLTVVDGHSTTWWTW